MFIFDQIYNDTLENKIIWESEYPIDLSQPNQVCYYFYRNQIKITLVSDYDAVCFGEMFFFEWYNEDNVLQRVSISKEYYNDLISVIGSKLYETKVEHSNDNINTLNGLLDILVGG